MSIASHTVAANHWEETKESDALDSVSIGVAWICSVVASAFGVSKTLAPHKVPPRSFPHAKQNPSSTSIKMKGEEVSIDRVLPPVPLPELKRKTLILDLDETLVHSTIKPVTHHHITVDVTIDGVACKFFVIKRPHVDTFLKKVAEWYEVIIFTASMQQYANPLIDQLDTKRVVTGRLFRESCLNKDGNFIKDLSLIEQDLSSTIIIDNSPIAYSHNKENALPIDNWMGDNPKDESLLNLLPFLNALRFTTDVRSILSLRT